MTVSGLHLASIARSSARSATVAVCIIATVLVEQLCRGKQKHADENAITIQLINKMVRTCQYLRLLSQHTNERLFPYHRAQHTALRFI